MFQKFPQLETAIYFAFWCVPASWRAGRRPCTWGPFSSWPQLTVRPAPRRYLLNVKFNILNKQIYNIFPFPWCAPGSGRRLGWFGSTSGRVTHAAESFPPLASPTPGLCLASTWWWACSS